MPSLPIVNAFLSVLIVCALLYTHSKGVMIKHTAGRVKWAIYLGEEETAIYAVYYAEVISHLQMLAGTWWQLF